MKSKKKSSKSKGKSKKSKKTKKKAVPKGYSIVVGYNFSQPPVDLESTPKDPFVTEEEFPTPLSQEPTEKCEASNEGEDLFFDGLPEEKPSFWSRMKNWWRNY
jgi:hypothetical protein